MSTDSDALHVLPVDDLVGHTKDAECVCGPEETWAQNGLTGELRSIFVHHSLDGRELREGLRDFEMEDDRDASD